MSARAWSDVDASSFCQTFVRTAASTALGATSPGNRWRNTNTSVPTRTIHYRTVGWRHCRGLYHDVFITRLDRKPPGTPQHWRLRGWKVMTLWQSHTGPRRCCSTFPLSRLNGTSHKYSRRHFVQQWRHWHPGDRNQTLALIGIFRFYDKVD